MGATVYTTTKVIFAPWDAVAIMNSATPDSANMIGVSANISEFIAQCGAVRNGRTIAKGGFVFTPWTITTPPAAIAPAGKVPTSRATVL